MEIIYYLLNGSGEYTMAFGPLVLPLIAAGASIAGQAINAGSQSATNQSQLSYAREMYEKQRADALADWNMQNQYNSPKEQMIRFKEAGLNPNLIYGQMSNSPVVRSSSPQSYNPTAPQADLGSTANMALSQYYDTQLKTAQIDLVKAQADATMKEALIKAVTNEKLQRELPYVAQNMEAQLSGQLLKNQAQVQQNKEMFPQQIAQAKANIQQTLASTNLTNEQKIKVSQEVQNLIKTGDLQEFEKKLKEFEVNNMSTQLILNNVTKLLGLIPGIGGLLKR